MSLRIEVIRATPDQEPILANLLELYAHDFSEFCGVEIGADGRFGYRDLPLYWSDPERHPFLIRVNGKLAGLVLVRRGLNLAGDATVWDMVEFFVLRGRRRHGVGVFSAHEVWRRFPGQWQVRVMESNPACLFWEKAIAEFVGDAARCTRIEKDGSRWRVFSFESGDVAQ